MDRRKFFDSLEYDIGLCILSELGAPDTVLNASRTFYQQLQCRYKVNRAFSKPCSRSNGFCQGDSFSLQVALAVMFLWTKFVKYELTRDLILHTGSFVDDSYFYSQSESSEEVAALIVETWKKSLQFDLIAGLQTNTNKSFLFANSGQVCNDLQQELEKLPADERLQFRNSFKLVGSITTAKGKPDILCRNCRVFNTIAKLKRVQKAPLRFAYRVRMTASIFNSAVFGTEQIELTVSHCDSLRSSVNHIFWHNKTWCRCSAITFTHIVPAHRVHPWAASIYHAFLVAHRMLSKRLALRVLFTEIWRHDSRSFGPVRRLKKAVQELAARWNQPFVITTRQGHQINLLSQDTDKFKHDLREILRQALWRRDRAYNNRQDMSGGGVLAYDANTVLLRSGDSLPNKPGNKKFAIGKPLSLFEHTCLRNIITGAVRTQLRLFKAHVVSTPVCAHCDMQVNEDAEHLFWRCPSWANMRKPFVDKYSGILDVLPPCARQCGLLPQSFLDDGTFTVAESQRFCIELQKTMVAILRAREKTSKDLHQCPGSHDNNIVVYASTHAIAPDQLAAQHHQNTKENLFPRYPWDYDEVCGPMNFFFVVAFPKIGALTKLDLNGCLVFLLFTPLVWYWSRLKWSTVNEDTISWLELAIDFHAATHCKLAMPNVSETGTALFQRARFFADASRRMACICRFALSPGACVASQYSLSSLGLGRTAGLTCRPQLLCKEFVHQCLFEIAIANTCQAVRLRQYIPRLWILPDPLWNDNVSKHRLVGKQAVLNSSTLAEVSKRRVVKSHRQATTSVSWTEDELACIEQAVNWRDRHRLEKIMLHNRNASKNGLHVLAVTQQGRPFRCSLCLRENVNLGKFIVESCAGFHAPRENIRAKNAPRQISILNKRKLLIQQHNATRKADQHLLQDITVEQEQLSCVLCKAISQEGWRRFTKFCRQVCTNACLCDRALE